MKKTISLASLFLLFLPYLPAITPPRLTVVCVVDQFSQWTWDRAKPFLRGGIRTLAQSGKMFDHAYYPHARPATACGHTALNTGAFAQDHGMVANTWQNKQGKVVQCDDDASAPVFSKNGLHSYGKSAKHILIPGISQAATEKGYAVVSLSHKSRSSICMAGNSGTALWFDDKEGRFTTSKAYAATKPRMLEAYNVILEKYLHNSSHIEWKSLYPLDDPAYNFSFVDDYRFAHPQPLINKKTALPKTLKKRSQLYLQTPHSCQALLNLALLHARMHHKEKPDTPLLLWISLSSLDILGHYYGPDSREAIDMIYQIDKQLQTFIKRIEKTYSPQETVWALTSDHGILSIPELIKSYSHKPQRINAADLIEQLNRYIYRRYNVKNLVTHFDIPYFYFNQDRWNLLSQEKQDLLLKECKHMLEQHPAIVHAWSYHDLSAGSFERLYGAGSRQTWFEKQYYAPRCGELCIMSAPYAYITMYDKGTSHCSPYDYDVRVPLLIKGSGRILPGSCQDHVSMRRLAPTLAHILDLPALPHAPLQPLVKTPF